MAQVHSEAIWRERDANRTRIQDFSIVNQNGADREDIVKESLTNYSPDSGRNINDTEDVIYDENQSVDEEENFVHHQPRDNTTPNELSDDEGEIRTEEEIRRSEDVIQCETSIHLNGSESIGLEAGSHVNSPVYSVEYRDNSSDYVQVESTSDQDHVIISVHESAESAAETAQAVESISFIQESLSDEGQEHRNSPHENIVTRSVIHHTVNGITEDDLDDEVIPENTLEGVPIVTHVPYESLQNFTPAQNGTLVNLGNGGHSGSNSYHTFETLNPGHLLSQGDVEEFFHSMERPVITSVSLSSANYTIGESGHLTTLTNASSLPSPTSYHNLSSIGSAGGLLSMQMNAGYPEESRTPPYGNPNALLTPLYAHSNPQSGLSVPYGNSGSGSIQGTLPHLTTGVWSLPTQESTYSTLSSPNSSKYSSYSSMTNDNHSNPLRPESFLAQAIQNTPSNTYGLTKHDASIQGMNLV